MDLPLYLELERFVEGREELEQTVKILLMNEIGSFLHDFVRGSTLSVHVSNNIDVDYSIRRALSVLENFQIIHIDSSKFPNIDLTYRYAGATSKFMFILEDKKDNAR